MFDRIGNGLWWDAQVNPIVGCTPESAGCFRCYAEKMVNSGRYPALHQGRRFEDIRFYPERLSTPRRWRKPKAVFVCNLSDPFHPDVQREWIKGMWGMCADSPQHFFLFLTKRASRMAEETRMSGCYRNMGFGVTVESFSQTGRISELKRVPTAFRFISFEPLLSVMPEIDWRGIHWAIIGEESGPYRRFAETGAVESLIYDAQKAGVPVFVKQVNIGGKLVKMPHVEGRVWDQVPKVDEEIGRGR